MATNSDKKKVFDVAKPGKTAAEPSSRPLIIGHKNILKDPMVKDEEVNDMASKTDNVAAPTEPEDKPSGTATVEAKTDDVPTAPTVSRIKIEPLSENKEEKVKKSSKAKSQSEMPPTEDSKPEDSISEESTEAEQTTDEPDQSQESTSKDDESAAPTSSAEAATVDAVASQAGTQKKNEQEAKEEVARQATVDKLVANKKYFVPINVASRKRKNRWNIVVLVLLLIVAAAYLAIDAGLVDPGFDVPVDIIQN